MLSSATASGGEKIYGEEIKYALKQYMKQSHRSLPLMCASTLWPFSSSTWNMVFGNFSTTVPSISITYPEPGMTRIGSMLLWHRRTMMCICVTGTCVRPISHLYTCKKAFSGHVNKLLRFRGDLSHRMGPGRIRMISFVDQTGV